MVELFHPKADRLFLFRQFREAGHRAEGDRSSPRIRQMSGPATGRPSRREIAPTQPTKNGNFSERVFGGHRSNLKFLARIPTPGRHEPNAQDPGTRKRGKRKALERPESGVGSGQWKWKKRLLILGVENHTIPYRAFGAFPKGSS